MQSSGICRRLLWCAGSLLCHVAHAASVGAPPPLANVVALAAAEHIPLTGIDPPRTEQMLRPGDTVTALFTLTEGAAEKQWLAEVTIVPLREEERGRKPKVPVIYTGSGHQFQLNSPPAAYTMRMFGPIIAGSSPAAGWREKRTRFTLAEDFLAFGFDQMSEIALRLRDAGEVIQIGFTTGPFPPERLAAGKAWAQRVGFSQEDELVCAKQSFATVEFLMLADHTPGFREIAAAAAEMPSFWTALRKRNFGLFFSYDWKRLTRSDGTAHGLSTPVYELPFSLTMFGTHVANGSWLVTAARPPLLACAGVIGLTIEPPGNPDKRLVMRIIAARNAKS